LGKQALKQNFLYMKCCSVNQSKSSAKKHNRDAIIHPYTINMNGLVELMFTKSWEAAYGTA
jgi:hypothetical protein